MSREFNTITRQPWNPVIKKCLDAIDTHTLLHLQTGDAWHLSQAEVFRQYVRNLKDWIHQQEKLND